MIILFNTGLLGYQVSYAARLQGDPHPISNTTQRSITCFFVGELALRMFAVGRKFFTGEDVGWNILDVIVVTASLVELFLQVVVQTSSSNRISLLRVLRVVRAVRVIRVIRILRFFKELRMMVYSIIHCMKSLMWVITLLVSILFMFAVIFVQLSTEYREEAGLREERTSAALAFWFGSLPRGMYTLFQVITGGVDWDAVADALEEVHWICVPALCFYVCFMLFAVLNIITAVFVEGAISSAQGERAAMVQEEIDLENGRRKELKRLFNDLDADKNGFIDIQEFEEALAKEDIQAFFRMVHLRLDDAWELFRLCDRDHSNTVNRDEFVFGCLKLSGNAKHMDLAIVMEDMRKSLSLIHRSILDISEGRRAWDGQGSQGLRSMHLSIRRSRDVSAAHQTALRTCGSGHSASPMNQSGHQEAETPDDFTRISL